MYFKCHVAYNGLKGPIHQLLKHAAEKRPIKSGIPMGYTVRKVLADFAVCDWWHYCKALCDIKFSPIEGNGRKFS